MGAGTTGLGAGLDATGAGVEATTSGAAASDAALDVVDAACIGPDAGAMPSTGTAMDGKDAGALAGAATAGAALAGADAPPSLFRSEMFLDISLRRAAVSWACLASATLSSGTFLPLSEPLVMVSLSGALVEGFLSSTWAWTVPLAERLEPATSVVGAAPANLRRKVLKSRLCAASTWRASVCGMAAAAASSGICRTAPALRRLTLPWMNASGLARIMATNI